MQLDDFARGAVASLMADQVRQKTGFAYTASGGLAVLALLGTVFLGGWWRALAIVLVLMGLAALGFVFLTKRVALVVVNRLGPPADLGGAREYFAAAIEEADVPTGPVGFLRLIWRLRRGVGPELERLGVVVSKLKGQLD